MLSFFKDFYLLLLVRLRGFIDPAIGFTARVLSQKAQRKCEGLLAHEHRVRTDPRSKPVTSGKPEDVMKHIHTAFALALAATVIAGPAVAQQKITVEVGAPAGYDIKRANRGPSAGWANWCINENKGKRCECVS